MPYSTENRSKPPEESAYFVLNPKKWPSFWKMRVSLTTEKKETLTLLIFDAEKLFMKF